MTTKPIDAREHFTSEMIERVVSRLLQPYEQRGIAVHLDSNDDPEVIKSTRETVHLAYSMLADVLRGMAGIPASVRHGDWRKAREMSEALEGEQALLNHLGEVLEDACDDNASEHADDDEDEDED